MATTGIVKRKRQKQLSAVSFQQSAKNKKRKAGNHKGCPYNITCGVVNSEMDKDKQRGFQMACGYVDANNCKLSL
ncbi:MAG: hypothetical protein OXU79_02030 [Gemmatimonadota bacterium]|nr:hypothetical protein [Gemmatimonadota bacterium]